MEEMTAEKEEKDSCSLAKLEARSRRL